ncbi:MAG TPA: hypothetical protein VFP10_12355 [Candidatus Eisenbacteria bacterium]|nr:hypothetical protein [Candidatus Eisenbacteria bacterium]
MVATGHITTAGDHTHAQDDVTGLPAALDGKASTGHNHTGTYAPAAHNHDAAYSAAGHNHDAAYSAAGHTHADKVSDPGAWTALTPATNVQHWSTAQAEARLTDDGMIELSGSLELTGAVNSGVAWGDMPAGMEPKHEMRLAARSVGTGAASNIITIATDGTLSFGVSLTAGARLPLDNIRIRRI